MCCFTFRLTSQHFLRGHSSCSFLPVDPGKPPKAAFKRRRSAAFTEVFGFKIRVENPQGATASAGVDPQGRLQVLVRQKMAPLQSLALQRELND